MQLQDVTAGKWMHHTQLRQGRRNSEALRVRVTSVRVWRRVDKMQIRYRWGWRNYSSMIGTKADVEAELKNWHIGELESQCSICKARKLGQDLLQWHGGQTTALYGVGSQLHAGRDIVDLGLLMRGLEELRNNTITRELANLIARYRAYYSI